MKLTNSQMEAMLEALGPLLEQRNVVGYAAAKNYKRIREELREFLELKEKTVRENGKPVLDAEGNPTANWEVTADMECFARVAADLQEWAALESDVDIYTIPAEKAVGVMSGKEMLELDWMLEEE